MSAARSATALSGTCGAAAAEIDRGDRVVELRQLRVERMMFDDFVDSHVADAANRRASERPRSRRPEGRQSPEAERRDRPRELLLAERILDIRRDVRSPVNHVGAIDDQEQLLVAATSAVARLVWSTSGLRS